MADDRNGEKEIDQSTSDHGADIDPALQRELDVGEFAGQGQTVEGAIVDSGSWNPGDPIRLTVRMPLPDLQMEDNVTFTEELPVPSPDEKLSESKFGRILDDHGLSRSQAEHLTDEPLTCTYTADGWEIVDPAPADSHTSTGKTQSSGRSMTPSTSCTSESAPRRDKRAKLLLTSGVRGILGVVIFLVFIEISQWTGWMQIPPNAPQGAVTIMGLAMSFIFALISLIILIVVGKIVLGQLRLREFDE